MSSLFSLRGLLTRQPTTAIRSTIMAPIRLFSTSSTLLKRDAPPPPRRTGQPTARRSKGPVRSEHYNRIRTLKQNMFSPAPPPLRMARLRWLRHWTIHRAWLLFRRQQKDAALKERMRMHQGMFNACEELRKIAGPGDRSEGYLYRVAMEKKGVWGLNGVPIEYARLQTDSPASEPWNHGWTR